MDGALDGHVYFAEGFFVFFNLPVYPGGDTFHHVGGGGEGIQIVAGSEREIKELLVMGADGAVAEFLRKLVYVYFIWVYHFIWGLDW